MMKRMNIYVLIILCCALSLLISYLYHNSNDNYKIINKLSNIFLQLNKHVEIFKSNYIVVPSSIISLNHTGFYSFQQYLMKQGIQLPHNISFDFDYHIVNEYFEHINSIVIPDYFNKTIITTSSIAGRMTFLDYINSTNRMKLLEYINHTSNNINLHDYFNTTSLHHLRGYYDASLDLQDYYYKAAQNFSLHRVFNTSVSSSSSLSYLQLHDILNTTENNINEYILDYIMHANNHRIDSASTTSMNKKITASTTTTASLPDKLEEKINKFQWIFYLKMNPDILAKGMITTYELALEHYIQKGYKQRRWSNVNEQPSEYACLLGKDVIPLQLFLKRCNYQQNIIIKNKLRSIIQQLHNNSSISSSRSKKQTDNQIMKDQISGDNNSIDNNNNNSNSSSSSSSSTSNDINNSNNNNHSLQQKLKVFDYKFYLKMNPDLSTAGILTKQRAIEHYKKSGYHRNRWSNPHEKPSLEACTRVRKFLEAKEFLLYCNLFSTSSIYTSTSTSSTTLSSLLPSATTTSSSSSSSTSSSSNNVTDNTNKEIKDPITINPIFPLDVMKAKIDNLIQQKLSSDSNNSSRIKSNSSVDIIDSKPTTTITTTTPVLLNASIIKATSINEKTITTTNVSDSNTVTDNHIVVVENIRSTTKNTTEILTFIDDSMAVPIPSNWTLQMSKSNNSNNHHTGIFDWRFYLKFNPDLSLAGITTEIEAKEHYHKYGSIEGRWSNAYELPTESACIRMIDFVPIEEFSKYCTYSIFDRETLQKRMNHRLSTFDWEFYLKYNPDLISLKLITQQHAIAHYKRYGFYERRWSCYEELPSLSACIRAKSILTKDEFINKCSIDNNDHNNNSNSNSSKNSYNKNNVGSFITNNFTTPIVNNEINTKASIRVDNYNNTASEKVDNTTVQTINKKKMINVNEETMVEKKSTFNEIIIKVNNFTVNNNELPTKLHTLSVYEVPIKVDNSTINKRDVITKHENVTTVVNKEVIKAESVSVTKGVGEEVGVVKN